MKSFAKSLKLIDKYSNLDNPEEVKRVYSQLNVANTRERLRLRTTTILEIIK